MKLKKHLSFSSLREMLSNCFDKIPDQRQVSKTEYSIHDALMSGFACMMFQTGDDLFSRQPIIEDTLADSYGHGENLSFNFYLLTLIAFAFHQIFELTDKLYQKCRQHFGSKRHLWENLRANLRTFIFSSWEYLLNFTLNPENYISGQLPAPD